LVIALELSAGLAVFTGILARPAAFALGLFCIATAFVFHFNPADHAETTMFAKDLALAGALLALAMAQAPSRDLQDPA
jgi:putative oxidoreductase